MYYDARLTPAGASCPVPEMVPENYHLRKIIFRRWRRRARHSRQVTCKIVVFSQVLQRAHLSAS